jgi:ketosteroid isomerase-like protein
MSQENVEVVRAAFEAWNSGDMDALRETYDPDAIVVRGLEGWPEPGPFIGREAIMQAYEQLREAWNTDAMELLSVSDSADRVVVRQLWHGAGHGPEARIEFSQVFTLRKGKVFLLEYFWNHAEALEAVGLSE